MKYLYKLPFRTLSVSFAFLCLSAQAQELPDFDDVDTDGNGLLSIEEAREAFPGVDVRDSNGDGWLNHAEIEASLDGLDLYPDEVGGEMYSVIGVYNYGRIVSHLAGSPDIDGAP